uniref:TIGR03936 family radical SAM-associated protein n=1 Tax=Candidatus Ruminimicrobium bovinum TaxID=3242779 RepID=UPI0039B9A8C1
PWRARSTENILNLLDKGIAATGYEEVSFSSLSCTDYKNLEELLLKTNEKYSSKNITVSLPSMRCNQFSLKVAEYINRDKKPTITFAPEAGSNRLRNVIGKYLSETDIINTLTSANAMGWKTIKLYFMIGLPTETEEDISAISELIYKIKKITKGLNFNITISPFVPKAQTAFQWQAMFSAEYFADVISRLKKNVPATIKAHDYKESIIEAVLARGDRKLSKAIYIAWQKGLRFDQWTDRFNYDKWIQSVAEAGLDLNFYVYRQRSKNEILPWQHINLGLTNEQLYNDYLKGISENDSSDYTNYKRDINLPKNYALTNNLPTQSSVRVLLKFSRKGLVKYLSQLEQIDFLRRTLKRTSLPVTYTAGFSPLIKTSFGPAVSVGHESDCEYVDLYMTQKVSEENIMSEISKVLPEGYKILQAKYLPLKFPAINSLVNVVEYSIEGVNITREQINSFLKQKEILIKKVKKQKETIVDVKDQILEISKISENKIKILLEIKQQNNVKLNSILSVLLNLNENDVKILYIKRENMFIKKGSFFYEI